MTHPKILALLVVLFCGSGVLRAQLVETYTFSSFDGAASLTIPDGQAAGVSDPRTLASAIAQVSSVKVTLDITGDFNGDLYAYLRHDTGLSVLLNRPGRSTGTPSGYADSGFSVTFDASAPNGDIHSYRNVLTPSAGSPLTGTWQPDGRAVDPALSFDTSPRTAGLEVFNGMNAHGTWTLFLADLQTGGTSAVTGWGMELSGVPEPSHSVLAVGLALLTGAVLMRRRRTVLPE